MRKIRLRLSKVFIFILALFLPISFTGIIGSFATISNYYVSAETSKISYYLNYIEDVSVTNSNFNASTVSTISQSPSGWTKQENDGKTTAGIINVNNFESYKDSTYYLSVNPGAKGNDNQILMINSKTSTSEGSPAREGFASNSISLSANSYYSFQVSFKSDSNYTENITYTARGGDNGVNQDVTIYQSNFNSVDFDDYVQITYLNTTYYAYKTLTEEDTISNDLVMPDDESGIPQATPETITSTNAFYYDSEYVGFLYDIDNDGTTTPIYVSVDDIVSITIGATTTILTSSDDTSSTTTLGENVTIDFDNVVDYEDYLLFYHDSLPYYISKTSANYTVSTSATYYTCDITFNPNTNSYTSGSYTLPEGSQFYSQNTEYDSEGDYGTGSVYINGLVDDDGNEVLLSFEKVISTEWTTFYFFIATGDTEQTVTIELWLGSDYNSLSGASSSSGVVYFDEVKVFQYSENYFYDTYFNYLQNKVYGEDNLCSVKYTNLKSYDEIEFGEEYNFDFESNDDRGLKGFKKTGGSGSAQIVALSKDEFENETGYNYAGSNLNVYESFDENGTVSVTKNTQALALWTDGDYVEVTTENGIEIEMHMIYKITVDFKLIDVDGSAYLIVTENDTIYTEYNLNENLYTTTSGSVSGSSNGSSNFNNSYSTLTIYVKGSDLYNSEINLTFALGSEDETATGCVVFDDIRVEKVTYSEFSEASSTVTLGEISSTLSIDNGYFNYVEIDGYDYPLTPSSWTIEKTTTNSTIYSGIINTSEEEYAKYKAKYEAKSAEYNRDTDNPYYWATFANPGSALSIGSENSNNILMLANLSPAGQTVTSPTFSLSASSYYHLSFNYLARNVSSSDASFVLKIYTEQGILLYEDEYFSTTWADCDIYFETFKGAETVYLEIEFGSESEKKSGIVYLDNFEIESIDALPTNNSATLVDMTDYYINLSTNNIIDEGDNIANFSSSAYTGSSNGDNSDGGIVTNKYLQEQRYTEFVVDTENNLNLFYIQTKSTTIHTIESVFNFDLTSGSYYQLSFMLQTKFTYTSHQTLPDDFDINDCSFGVTIGLTNFDYIGELKSNGKYQEFIIYFYATEDTTSQLLIALESHCEYTTGTMVIYNLTFEEIGTDDDVPSVYTAAETSISRSDYDVNEARVAIASYSETEEEEAEDDDGSDSDTTSENDYAWLLYISSIITGLAIIIAIVGYYLRKIKIKKIEIKRKETYDRKGSLHKDVIRQEAEQERAKEIERLEQDIKKFEIELENVEKEHKEKVVKLRKDDRKVVSKSTEKEFKLFAQKRSVITEKIDILKHQLENVKSPEYLLSLERRKFLENDAKQRQLKKESKKVNKENEKADKENEKSKKKGE